jgi:hypothetical protein
LVESIAMARSKRLSALAYSPFSNSFRASSDKRRDAARCGGVPGIILAISELSSTTGGFAGVRVSGDATGGGVSFEVVIEGGAFSLVFRSCSRIFGSAGIDRLLGSASGEEGGGLGIGAGVG